MLNKILAVSFALAATSSLAEGVIIWQPPEIPVRHHLTHEVSPSLGDGETSAVNGIAVNAQFLDENQNPTGLYFDDGEGYGNLSGVSWDGLLIDQQKPCEGQDASSFLYEAAVRIHQKNKVELCGLSLDLSNPDDFSAFNAIAKDTQVTLSQLPLIIVDGALDVRQVENAPKAIRRFIYQLQSGVMGVYQTTTAMSLYHASVELSKIAPAFPGDNISMAAALPMGQHDFCLEWESASYAVTSCGANDPNHPPRLYLTIQTSPP